MRLVILLFLLAACGAATTTAGECTDTQDTWTSYGSAFFASQCRSCHQHAAQFGTQASVQASLNQLASEISSGKMPQGAALSTAEKTRVLGWLACGAP